MSKKVSISVTKKGKEFFAKAPWNQPKKKTSFKKKVIRAINPEKKYIDTALVNSQTGTTGSVTHLTGIAAGDTAVTRDGRKVNVQSILLRFRERADTDNTFGDFSRIMLVRDTQQVADTAPAIGDILDSVDVLSPLNGNSGNRFKVIKEWFHPISCGTNPGAGYGGVRCWKFYKKLETMLQFNGDSANDIQKNGLYLVVLHETNTAGSLTALDMKCRVRFTDN